MKSTILLTALMSATTIAAASFSATKTKVAATATPLVKQSKSDPQSIDMDTSDDEVLSWAETPELRMYVEHLRSAGERQKEANRAEK